MKKGSLAQPIIAQRVDVCEELKLVFLSCLQELDPHVVVDLADDIGIELAPGISILPQTDSQRLAATPDMVIFLKQSPKILMTVEIKFTINWKESDAKEMLTRYSDQCKMQVMVLNGIGAILLLADSSLATNLTDVRRVSPICQFVTRVIRPDSVWVQETRASINFLSILSNRIIPQLLNGQDQTYNPLASSTYNKAVQVVEDGTHRTRNGRSYRGQCEAYVIAKYVNFEILQFTDRYRDRVLVRKQTGVSSEEAAAINKKILSKHESGLYLVKSNGEHNGCSRPISVDAQFSPEQWSEIHKEMLHMKGLQVSNEKIALMLATKYHCVGKTSQDVSNILVRLETERLAEEGQILLTNGEGLISALDNLPVLSIVLFDIFDGKGNKILQIIRIKGLHGAEPKIAYLQYQDWSILQKEIRHSLLMCYKDPVASSFPITDETLKKYLYLFSTPNPALR